MSPPPRHRTSAVPLAWAYAALIVYASLYPFYPWRVPGVSPLAFLGLPWPRFWTWFDVIANGLGYVPLGALLFGAQVRRDRLPRPALLLAFAGGTLLSLTLEFLQNFLPQRVSSNVDLALNAGGTLAGAAIGYAVHARRLVDSWQSMRDRWFIAHGAGGLALLLLWPVGLLFPLPVVLGQGQVLEKVQVLVGQAVEDTPLAPWFEGWADVELDAVRLSPAGEFTLIALGLLAPCMVALAIARRGWRRPVLVAGAAVLGGLATTLSTALNFGPQHMLAWCTPQALAALGFALLLAEALTVLPRRAAAGVGLVALTAMVAIVAQAPADPFFAQSLRFWDQGRFIRFYGLARWIGWLWPYAAIAYLLTRLAARPEAPPEAASTEPPRMPP